MLAGAAGRSADRRGVGAGGRAGGRRDGHAGRGRRGCDFYRHRPRRPPIRAASARLASGDALALPAPSPDPPLHPARPAALRRAPPEPDANAARTRVRDPETAVDGPARLARPVVGRVRRRGRRSTGRPDNRGTPPPAGRLAPGLIERRSTPAHLPPATPNPRRRCRLFRIDWRRGAGCVRKRRTSQRDAAFVCGNPPEKRAGRGGRLGRRAGRVPSGTRRPRPAGREGPAGRARHGQTPPEAPRRRPPFPPTGAGRRRDAERSA